VSLDAPLEHFSIGPEESRRSAHVAVRLHEGVSDDASLDSAKAITARGHEEYRARDLVEGRYVGRAIRVSEPRKQRSEVVHFHLREHGSEARNDLIERRRGERPAS
jgi:hypothetical protein